VAAGTVADGDRFLSVRWRHLEPRLRPERSRSARIRIRHAAGRTCLLREPRQPRLSGVVPTVRRMTPVRPPKLKHRGGVDAVVAVASQSVERTRPGRNSS